MKPSEKTWCMVDCQTSNLIVDDITAILKFGNYLITSHFRSIALWDISDPLNIIKLSENTSAQGGKLKVCGDKLVSFGKKTHFHH